MGLSVPDKRYVDIMVKYGVITCSRYGVQYIKTSVMIDVCRNKQLFQIEKSINRRSIDIYLDCKYTKTQNVTGFLFIRCCSSLRSFFLNILAQSKH